MGRAVGSVGEREGGERTEGEGKRKWREVRLVLRGSGRLKLVVIWVVEI